MGATTDTSGGYDRRTFLRRAGLAGAGAAALAVGVARPAAAEDADLAPFLHGVASGDPADGRVILWTRVTPPDGHHGGPIAVEWVIATDPELTDVVGSGGVQATADRDWCVKVDADGLQPFTYYFYGFTALGSTSLTGRTKTAPAVGQGTDHLRFGLVSCANYQHGYFNAYARLSERDDLDAIIHLGDYLYEYQVTADGGYGYEELSGIRDHEPPVEMVTLDDYRVRHSFYKLDPDLRRLHQLFPMIATWDDHESTDNSYRDGAANHDPDGSDQPNEVGVEWPVRKAASQRAYNEWMPLRADDPAKIYRSLSYGDLAEIIMLDTRLEGRDQQIVLPGQQDQAAQPSGLDAAVSDPDRHLISPEQMAWFQERLEKSSSQWKIVGQQVVVGQWSVPPIARLDETLGLPDAPQIIADGGSGLNPDSWDGYTADRDRFLDFIRDNQIDDVVVLTGDVHSSWAMDLNRDPSNPASYNPVTAEGSVAVEFVVPATTSAAIAEIAPAPVNELHPAAATAFQALNPHMKYVDLLEKGYVVLDLTPEGAQADWFFVDTVMEPSDGQAHGASWRTDAGTNHLVSATESAAKDPASALPPTEPPAPTQPGGSTPADGDAQDDTQGGAVLPTTGGGAGLAALGAVAAATVLRLRGRRDNAE